MSWWWAGAIGAAKFKHKKASEHDRAGRPQNVALVVGVTSVVGSSLAEILPSPDTPGGPWKVYGVAQDTQPNWIISNLEYIQCNILDLDETQEKLSKLIEVTHVFYVASSKRLDESETCIVNGTMLRNVLRVMIPNATCLKHICLQTGRRHYTGPSESSSKIARQYDPPFHEDLPRLKAINFCYTLEDVLLEEVRKKEGLTWSIHRPGVIFGHSATGLTNVVAALCVYAAICKHLGKPLRFPGSRAAWNGYWDASDADLVAEHQLWAALSPNAKNEAFNCSNGDVFKWKNLWKILAQEFGIEDYGFDENDCSEKLSLFEVMTAEAQVWEEIVKEKGLVPNVGKLETWRFVDSLLNGDSLLDSMNKSRGYGFVGFRDTSTSFIYWIGKMKDQKIVP